MLFPKGETPVQITLYKNVPFSNDYSNHIFRPDGLKGANDLSYDTSHMVDFLECYVYLDDGTQEYKFPHITLTDNFNFDYGNGILTSIVLEIPSDYTESNYMYVYGQNGNIQYKFYFFIKSCTIMSSSGSNVTCKLELELDVLATYDNDILKGLDGVPLLTERKHCQRFSIGDGTNFYCSDLVTNENVTNNINQNVIQEVKTIETNVGGLLDTNLSKVRWFYVMCEGTLNPSNEYDYPSDTIANLQTPVTTICCPDVKNIIFHFENGDSDITFTRLQFLNSMYDDTHTYSIKVSPYPPFTSLQHNLAQNLCAYDIDNDTITFTIDTNAIIGTWTSSDLIKYYRIYFGNNVIIIHNNQGKSSLQNWGKYGFAVPVQKDVIYPHKTTGIRNWQISKPIQTTEKSEVYEPKLQMYPVKKYLVKSMYSNDGIELHPEIVASQQPLGISFTTESVATIYGGDLTFSSYMIIQSKDYNSTSYYKDINKGLIASANYMYPVGDDALKSFQTTQSASFNAQTTAKVIGGALQIAGGVAVGIGAGWTGVGAVAGGSMIAGGVVTIGESVNSAVAKYTDLSNTPDTISNIGGNVVHDVSVGNTLFPFLCIFDVTSSEKEILLDYFYRFGYNIQRTCYLNSSLKASDYTDYNWIDTRLLTRSNFNYIKLGEDITNKIDTPNIPYVCKQKIANIFKNGITLWTLFNSDITEGYSYDDIEPYFLREKYENVEVDL